jgi:hypothetical protein
VRYAFNLAADIMGGMGFIETRKADCMLSVLINTYSLMAAHSLGRTFFLQLFRLFLCGGQSDQRRCVRHQR